MKKRVIFLIIPFLFSCNGNEYELIEELFPIYPLTISSYEMGIKYNNDKAELVLNNQFTYSTNDVYDAKKDQINILVPGDVLDFYYANKDDAKENYKSIFIHKAYILELNKIENGYYNENLDININPDCIDSLNYIIKDTNYHYDSINNVNVNDKIYVSINEEEFLNQGVFDQEKNHFSYNFACVYSFNPRTDNSLIIKNVLKYNNHQPIMNNHKSIINSVDDIDELVVESKKYNDEFFKNNSLIVLYFNENSGSISHNVKRVQLNDNGLDVFVDINRPEIGDCSMAYWQIIVEVEKISSSLKINLFTY